MLLWEEKDQGYYLLYYKYESGVTKDIGHVQYLDHPSRWECYLPGLTIRPVVFTGSSERAWNRALFRAMYLVTHLAEAHLMRLLS